MCAVDFDPPEFSVHRTHTARKPHTCGECGRVIAIGEKYDRIDSKYDGHMWSNKACAHCVGARGWLVKHCEGYLIDGLTEELSEHWHDEGYRTDGLGRLVVGIRRSWRRFDGAGLMPVPVVARDA